jgi:AIPR protein
VGGDPFETLKREVAELTDSFGDNAFLLYAMGLRLGTMDYTGLRDDALLDDSDDKKVDFFHIGYENGVVTVAQGYQAADWSREAAPANKAADLNTAMGWLLEGDLDNIGQPSVRAAAEQVRDALEEGQVSGIDIFYVHNLPASQNVADELNTVRATTVRLVDRYNDATGIDVACAVREVSRDVVEEWRRSRHEAISVHDDVTLTSSITPQEIRHGEWQAVLASVPMQELIDLYDAHRDALFSANVRDYLGSRESARNINRQIERTVQEEPENFFVYNNGLTVLTNSLEVDDGTLRLGGISIINGAQTTGSVVTAAAGGSDVSGVNVLIRVIRSNQPELVRRIIRFNNTQNPIKAWELRVIDPIQDRLRQEFDGIGVTYQLRRGYERRQASDVHYDQLGPFISAFYGDPIAAHKNKADLYESESRYHQLFRDESNVRNLLFIYRLGRAVAITKSRLREKIDAGNATQDEQRKFEYFRYGAFAFVLMHVVAELLGLWLGGQAPDYKRRVTLPDEILLDQNASEEILAKVVEIALGPVDAYLTDQDAYQVLKTQPGVAAIAQHSKTLIEQVERMQPENYNQITEKLVLV